VPTCDAFVARYAVAQCGRIRFGSWGALCCNAFRKVPRFPACLGRAILQQFQSLGVGGIFVAGRRLKSRRWKESSSGKNMRSLKASLVSDLCASTMC